MEILCPGELFSYWAVQTNEMTDGGKCYRYPKELASFGSVRKVAAMISALARVCAVPRMARLASMYAACGCRVCPQLHCSVGKVFGPVGLDLETVKEVEQRDWPIGSRRGLGSLLLEQTLGIDACGS